MLHVGNIYYYISNHFSPIVGIIIQSDGAMVAIAGMGFDQRL